MSSYKVIRGVIVTEIERPQWKAPLPDLRDDDFASFTPPPGTSLQTALPATTVLALHNHQIMGKGLFEFALLLTTEPYLAGRPFDFFEHVKAIINSNPILKTLLYSIDPRIVIDLLGRVDGGFYVFIAAVSNKDTTGVTTWLRSLVEPLVAAAGKSVLPIPSSDNQATTSAILKAARAGMSTYFHAACLLPSAALDLLLNIQKMPSPSINSAAGLLPFFAFMPLAGSGTENDAILLRHDASDLEAQSQEPGLSGSLPLLDLEEQPALDWTDWICDTADVKENGSAAEAETEDPTATLGQLPWTRGDDAELVDFILDENSVMMDFLLERHVRVHDLASTPSPLVILHNVGPVDGTASPSPACSHDTSEAHPTPVPPAPSIAGPNPSSSAADRDTEASSTPRHVQPSLVPVLLFDDTGRHMSVEGDNIDDGQEENTDGIQQKTTPTPPTGPVRRPLAPLSLQTNDFNIAGAAHFSFLAPFNVHSRVRSAPAQFSKL